jgi:hypothetical protein
MVLKLGGVCTSLSTKIMFVSGVPYTRDIPSPLSDFSGTDKAPVDPTA